MKEFDEHREDDEREKMGDQLQYVEGAHRLTRAFGERSRSGGTNRKLADVFCSFLPMPDQW